MSTNAWSINSTADTLSSSGTEVSNYFQVCRLESALISFAHVGDLGRGILLSLTERPRRTQKAEGRVAWAQRSQALGAKTLCLKQSPAWPSVRTWASREFVKHCRRYCLIAVGFVWQRVGHCQCCIPILSRCCRVASFSLERMVPGPLVEPILIISLSDHGNRSGPPRVRRISPNQALQGNRHARRDFGVVGGFGRWICCSGPIPASVGDLML